MSLNETLDRLAREQQERELRTEREMQQLREQQEFECNRGVINSLAARIFFERMLKEVNHGLSEAKIDAMIDRSVMIAQHLFKKLYK